MASPLGSIPSSTPLREKVVITAHFRRFYPGAVTELIFNRITELFLQDENIELEPGTEAKATAKSRLFRWSFSLEFEFLDHSSIMEHAELREELYYFLTSVGSYKFESDFQRLEEM